uniref:Sugar phosphate transporter domain-containing protein n=1 Tax=Cannabis sativa TaxID=3483 RepID=A0A803NZT3_CANSA
MMSSVKLTPSSFTSSDILTRKFSVPKIKTFSLPIIQNAQQSLNPLVSSQKPIYISSVENFSLLPKTQKRAAATECKAYEADRSVPLEINIELPDQQAGQKYKIGLYFATWWALNVVFNIYNKKVLNAFPYPWLTSLLSLAAGSLMMLISWATRIAEAPKTDLDFWKTLFPVAVAHTIGHVAATVSMSKVAVSFTHIIKSSEPAFSVLVSRFLLGEMFPMPVYLSLVPIIGGCALAAVTELNFNLVGFMGAMISNLAFVFRNIFSKKGMKGKSVSGMNYYACLSMLSLLILTPFAIAVEGPKMWAAGWNQALSQIGPHFVWWVAAQSIFYHLYNQVSYMSLDQISPLTFSVGNTMKRVSVIVSSIIIFHTPVQPINALGAAIAIFGTFLYSQYEGAYLSDGKGLSNWDVFTHKNGTIIDGTTGDIAVDQYHLYEEDLNLMNYVGVNSYRLSISWARILPKGRFGLINWAGIDYYNRLIDSLQHRGIEPFVTLTHYDIPQELEERYGAWLSSQVQEDFKYYADICFRTFGDRVKYWATFNEPNVAVIRGYRSGIFPPCRCSASFGNCTNGDSEKEPLIAAHNVILSHAAAVDLYRTKYQKIQEGSIGIVINALWYEPFSNSSEDKLAVNRAISFYMNWFLDPILHGKYPEEMREILGLDLPVFSKYEMEKLKKGIDFIGVNHYTSFYIKDCKYSECETGPGNSKTEGFALRTPQKYGSFIGQETEVDWIYVYPQGLENIIMYIKERYNNIPMFITENGYGYKDKPNLNVEDSLNDVERVEYMASYLSALASTIRKGADVRGYFAWSLLDNFEWRDGYSLAEGLEVVKDLFSIVEAETILGKYEIGFIVSNVAGYLVVAQASNINSPLPPNFLFGTASSAYQYEGAYLTDGKGLNNWDVYTHIPGNIIDGSNGDIAVDHYHRYLEDVKIMSSLGVNSYRFSISWTRILPKGIYGGVNPEGVNFYNNLIDALLLKGIEPFVTLTHYDIPQELEDRYGGWLSPKSQNDFAYFAETCFKHFGNRVKYWATFNEPNVQAIWGYRLGTFPPCRCSSHFGNCSNGDSEREPFIAAHNMILSHATAVHVYRTKYQKEQRGSIGIVLQAMWYEALTNSMADKAAAQRAHSFTLNWFLDPIIYGKYPAEMEDIVGSVLPKFSSDDKEKLNMALDFIGINHYSTYYVQDCIDSSCEPGFGVSWTEGLYRQSSERNGVPIGESVPAAVDWMNVYPQGMEKIVTYVMKRYNNTPMFITENGYGFVDNLDNNTKESLHDDYRVKYMADYLDALLKAVRNGADVRGYFAWSLLDNFEWKYGYTVRFGLHHVDYATLKRSKKLSATWYKKFIKKQKGKSIIPQHDGKGFQY